MNKTALYIAIKRTIIFRMKFYHWIYPEVQTESFYLDKVGISFAVKNKLFKEGQLFEPNEKEDFIYLNSARDKNYKIMISPYLTYFVRTYENNENSELGNRVFINF